MYIICFLFLLCISAFVFDFIAVHKVQNCYNVKKYLYFNNSNILFYEIFYVVSTHHLVQAWSWLP